MAKLRQIERDFSPEAQAYIMKTLGDTAGLYENKQKSNLPDYEKGTLETTYNDIQRGNYQVGEVRGEELNRVNDFLHGLVKS